MSKKYRGKVVKINPIWDNIKLLFISCTISNFKYDLKARPLFLFIYENDLYFGICDYEFEFLENYEDFELENGESLNMFFPKLEEFNFLKRMNPTYYRMDYHATINQDLGDFSDYELDLLKNYNRELTINKLLS